MVSIFFFSAGTALVEDIASLASNSNSPTTPTAAAKNNRMPGNIVCGICGAVRYYAFILQAKKFGTFSCEPCRKFISKAIKMCENDQDSDEESDDDEARPGGEQTRRRRRVNDIDPGDTSSDDEDNGAPPPRQSKEAIRVEGQALRDSILSGYFSANF